MRAVQPPASNRPLAQETDWRARESGILALGAISDGCANGLLPFLEGMLAMLLPRLGDARPLVRSITCWALSRYSRWLAQQPGASSQQADAVLQVRAVCRAAVTRAGRWLWWHALGRGALRALRWLACKLGRGTKPAVRRTDLNGARCVGGSGSARDRPPVRWRMRSSWPAVPQASCSICVVHGAGAARQARVTCASAAGGHSPAAGISHPSRSFAEALSTSFLQCCWSHSHNWPAAVPC